MHRTDEAPRPFELLLPELTIALWIFLIAGLTVLGSDLMWAVAMGDVIRETGTVPHSIPFATAAQGEWHNPIAVAQVLLSLVHATGAAGLAAFHLALVALTLSVVLAESRRLGSTSARASVVLTVVVVGCASPFVVVRLPDLSLVMFVTATALMRRQHDQPSERVWWLVPLFAVWGNLHGGVLVGVAVFAVFLAVSTSAGGVVKRLALAAMAGGALMMTSAGPGTPSYYLGVLGNEAATRGSELWAAPDLGDPLDLTMLAAAATLVALCVRRGLPAWEWVAAAGLLAGTVIAARNGVWLLLFLAPAAAGLPRGGAQRPAPSLLAALGRQRRLSVVMALAVVVGAGAGWQLARRGAEVGPAGQSFVKTVESVAAGRSVLADEPLAETLAQQGVKVWASNPIDAFPRRVQVDFIDFLDTGVIPAGARVDVAVVAEPRAAAAMSSGAWRAVAREHGYVVLVRG